MGTSIEPVSGVPYPVDAADVEQEQTIGPAILVRPDGPVTVHNLPSRSGPVTRDQLTSTAWTKVLSQDLRRKRAVLVFVRTVGTTDAIVVIGRGGSGTIAAASAAPWPINVPLPIEHCDALYAAAIGSDTMVCTAVTELWAD